ncbi:MAG: signal peptidase II [Candidatus Gracilibacteria bacterium]|nr:signal peptidase II [Candidatus Gracilibacteria bacterium]
MFYVIIIIGVLLDLLTKNLASLYLQDRLQLIGDFLYLQYIENTGIAFSIQLPSLVLKLVTIILIILIFYYYRTEKKNKEKNNLLDISFGLILAGAIGNGIERIFNEKVIDFIGVQYFSVFNLADSFITIGAVLYLYVLYRQNKG